MMLRLRQEKATSTLCTFLVVQMVPESGCWRLNCLQRGLSSGWQPAGPEPQTGSCYLGLPYFQREETSWAWQTGCCCPEGLRRRRGCYWCCLAGLSHCCWQHCCYWARRLRRPLRFGSWRKRSMRIARKMIGWKKWQGLAEWEESCPMTV